jgi:RND family efflux transporter MFP subunit
VDANEHVVRLVDPRRLEVTAAVPVADAARIRVGRAAKVAVPSSGEEATLPARVAAGAAAVDTATGTATVRLALEGVLPVGTAVQVEIAAEERKDAVVVPATAVVRDQDKAAVYVVGPDKHAHRREITLGLISGDEVQVLSGVRAGETVVVKGHEELPDGALVTVEKE